MAKTKKGLNASSTQSLTDSMARKLERIGYSEGKYSNRVFEDWVGMMACALSNQTREAEYLEIVKHYKPESLTELSELFGEYVIAAESFFFQDVLGPIHMELGSKSSKAATGEFYTPNEISYLMAKMTLGDIEVPDDRPLTICEPACGAGAMVLACGRHFVERGCSPLNMQVTAIDISKLAVNMCFVQTTLWGVPAVVVHGNALSLETWGTYQNQFYYHAKGKEDPFGRMLRLIREVESYSPPENSVVDVFKGQASFDFDLGA